MLVGSGTERPDSAVLQPQQHSSVLRGIGASLVAAALHFEIIVPTRDDLRQTRQLQDERAVEPWNFQWQCRDFALSSCVEHWLPEPVFNWLAELPAELVSHYVPGVPGQPRALLKLPKCSGQTAEGYFAIKHGLPEPGSLTYHKSGLGKRLALQAEGFHLV